MKFFIGNIILVSLLVTFINSADAVELKPSLDTQLKKQQTLDIKNYIKTKQSANLARLSKIQAKNSLKKNTPNKVIVAKNTSSPSLTPKLLIGTLITTSSASANQVQNVDINRVRDAWFGWYNSYRESLGLKDYQYDPRLDGTAHDWNLMFSSGKGQNHHRRNPSDGYYDFPVIDAWFSARGIDPKVVNRSKHTENVGYGSYSCSKSDCTDELISSIRSTWNFFMSEKGKSYDAHYRSIINPNFTKMGFDIITVPSEGKYYMTIHFITE